MKTTTKKATATTEKGTVLNLTVIAKRGYEAVTEKVWIDEYVERTSKKEINETIIKTVVNGVTYEGGMFTHISDNYKKQGVYAILADKLGISKAVYDILNAVILEAKKESETDENWMALQAKKAQALKEEAEYYKHYKAVENMMTLNGKTY